MTVQGRTNGTTSSKPVFFASEETTTVNLDEHYWVELKNELTYGEENELEGASLKAQVDFQGAGGSATPQLKYDAGNQREVMLALYIVDWNLPSANGKPIPLPDSLIRRQGIIKQLSSRWARQIITKIEELRRAEHAIDVIDLSETEGAEVDPTPPGDASELRTPSPSADGGAVSPTPISSERPLASSGKRSR
jgi:hypothetical protein